MASIGLKVIRSVFGAAEHIAPRITGRAAFELFCRTQSAKALTDGERRAIGRAAEFMTVARHHRLKAATGCVMVHGSRPEPGMAALSSLPAIFAGFSRMLNVGPRSQVAMADRVEHLSGRPLHEFTGDRQLAQAPVPTLVIHAPDDREVPAEHARRYAGAGGHVRLHWADGLGHRRILADKGVIERAVGFVAHREPSLLH